LRAVVLHGTGDPTAQIPGYATAGKTGTAQMVVDGAYRPGYYAASFIGMVPYPHARYLIYVKVERPIGSYYGSVVAAPAFAEIARAAMLHAGVLPSSSVARRGH
jgi:cell division protein FtsI/penicillin-binding protein 2